MNNLRRLLPSALLLAALTGLGGCGTQNVPAASAPTAAPASDAAAVLAEGRIVPRDHTMLTSGPGGTVQEVLVAEGERVAKGAVLLRLGDRESALAALAAAEADLTAAEQEADRLTRTADAGYHQALLDEAAARKAFDDALKAWNDFDVDRWETDLDDAKADVDTALSDLEDAQEEFDKYAGRVKDNADRKRTKRALDDAQARYDEALRRQHEIEAKYTKAASALETARGRLAEAERTRKLRETGPDGDLWALAQTRVDAARAGLAAAQAALAKLEIKAPYDGVAARIDASAGESLLPNQPVISFADLSRWFVETTDVVEQDAVKIRVGQRVVVAPDALPDLELTGTVERIGLTYTEKAGDILYTVRIRLDPTDAILLWGMTVEVRFFEE